VLRKTCAARTPDRANHARTYQPKTHISGFFPMAQVVQGSGQHKVSPDGGAVSKNQTKAEENL